MFNIKKFDLTTYSHKRNSTFCVYSTSMAKDTELCITGKTGINYRPGDHITMNV